MFHSFDSGRWILKRSPRTVYKFDSLHSHQAAGTKTSTAKHVRRTRSPNQLTSSRGVKMYLKKDGMRSFGRCRLE